MILSKYRIIVTVHILICAKYLVHQVIDGVVLLLSPYPYGYWGWPGSPTSHVFDGYMLRRRSLVLRSGVPRFASWGPHSSGARPVEVKLLLLFTSIHQSGFKFTSETYDFRDVNCKRIPLALWPQMMFLRRITWKWKSGTLFHSHVNSPVISFLVLWEVHRLHPSTTCFKENDDPIAWAGLDVEVCWLTFNLQNGVVSKWDTSNSA